MYELRFYAIRLDSTRGKRKTTEGRLVVQLVVVVVIVPAGFLVSRSFSRHRQSLGGIFRTMEQEVGQR